MRTKSGRRYRRCAASGRCRAPSWRRSRRRGKNWRRPSAPTLGRWCDLEEKARVSDLGVGLIGCGAMGRGLAKALKEIEGARLAGVADVDPAALAASQAELEAPGFASAEALLEQPGVQAVIIASPGFQHRPLTELAAAAGKAVFVEKPMATTTADCDAMIGAAERAGVLLMVGLVLRFYP